MCVLLDLEKISAWLGFIENNRVDAFINSSFIAGTSSCQHCSWCFYQFFLIAGMSLWQLYLYNLYSSSAGDFYVAAWKCVTFFFLNRTHYINQLNRVQLHMYKRKLSERPGDDMCPGNFAERTPHKKILQISPPGSLQTTKSEKKDNQIWNRRRPPRAGPENLRARGKIEIWAITKISSHRRWYQKKIIYFEITSLEWSVGAVWSPPIDLSLDMDTWGTMMGCIRAGA